MSPGPSTSTEVRTEEAGDWIARQFFAPEELHLDPEEYVARHSHSIGCFAFDRYRFLDPGLGSWVRQVGQLLASDQEVERCRGRFLSPEEMALVRRSLLEEF